MTTDQAKGDESQEDRSGSRFGSFGLVIMRGVDRLKARSKSERKLAAQTSAQKDADIKVVVGCDEDQSEVRPSLATSKKKLGPKRDEAKKSISWQVDENKDVDSGYAWIILFVVFVINTSAFGSNRAYGHIYEYTAKRDNITFKEAATPFTIMGAVENMSGPLTGYLLVSTGSWRLIVFLGSCLVTMSHLLVAYFSSQVGQILTLGLMCGIGQSFISISSFQINNAYFLRYRSRAFGMALTGAAVGTMYISPLCQYLLEHEGTSVCYMVLSLLMFPNVALSLLLKVKETYPIQTGSSAEGDNEVPLCKRKFSIPEAALAAVAAQMFPSAQIPSVTLRRRHSAWPTTNIVSGEAAAKKSETNKRDAAATDDGHDEEEDFSRKVSQVIRTPVFHLIWPTQLLYCWLNFVLAMIMTDFGNLRGLDAAQNSLLVRIWALGQLFGRLGLGSIIDMQIISYRSFTTICCASISLTIFSLTRLPLVSANQPELAHNLILLLMFLLAAFISTLYILFNGLVMEHMDNSVAALSIGISSFTGSFLLLPRAAVIGYFRSTFNNYDAMLTLFAGITMLTALTWQVVPRLLSHLEACQPISNQTASPIVSKNSRRCNSVPVNGISESRAKELLSGFSESNNRIAAGKAQDLDRFPTIEEESFTRPPQAKDSIKMEQTLCF